MTDKASTRQAPTPEQQVTTLVDAAAYKATPSEMAPASQPIFRYHPGHQTKLDSRNPVTRTTGYVDPGMDPVGYRTWLQTWEIAVTDAP